MTCAGANVQVMSMPTSNQPPFQAGGVWSSGPISSFSNLCIKSAVVNVFNFTETQDIPPGWAVVLKFGFNILSGDGEQFSVTLPGPFSSKKEAKAAAAQEGLKVLTEALAKKSSGNMGKDTDGNGDNAENENWIGLLGEYCQAKGQPMPMFQEFGLGSRYSMEVTIPDRPNEPFGGRKILFSSKKAAKANAAHEAVRWLRKTERMPRKGHPSKSTARAAGTESETVPFLRQTSTTGKATASGTSFSAVRVAKSASLPGSIGQKDCSLGEQVNTICRKLGCTLPIYKLTPDPYAASMWSGAAYFAHDPAVALPDQPVGEVRMIFGKKKTKEEIAKGVLKRLQEMMAKRQEEFKIASAGPMASDA